MDRLAPHGNGPQPGNNDPRRLNPGGCRHSVAVHRQRKEKRCQINDMLD
jgi:hypothetical protein